MTEIVWTAQSRLDLRRIVDFLKAKSENAAEKTVSNILKCERL